MSDLGHYVGDAHQPLHCTRNYDGQYTGNNGIHSRYETAMINTYQSFISVHTDSVQYIISPRDFAFDYIYHTNSLIDSVFAADNYAKSTSSWNGRGTPPPAYYTALWQRCQIFTVDQFQMATVDLASLWYTAWVNAGLSTNVEEILESFPKNVELLQNYPNPFNPVTNLSFVIGSASGGGYSSLVTLTVYDVLGREVATLVNEELQPGEYKVWWDGTYQAAGVYFYRLNAGHYFETKKLVLIK